MAAPGMQLALVMAGGALGAALRFWIGGAMLRQFGGALPWGTLAANLGGAFAVGLLATWLQDRGPLADRGRAFLIVGVLGALTTYSTLMLEMLLFARSGRIGTAAVYLGITLFAGLLLVWAGARFGAALR